MQRPPGPPPVRLIRSATRSCFAPERDTVMARVSGDGLRAVDLRHGDHVVLVHRDTAEHGDLAAVIESEGRAALWKVYPEGDRLRLSIGHPRLDRYAEAGARVQGVVVAVLRRLRAGPGPQADDDA